MDWNRWLWSLLIVLGGMLLGLAVVASIQAQTTTPAPQADPDNAEQVALGQQVYTSFCAGCHGGNLEGQPNWRQRLPLLVIGPMLSGRAADTSSTPTAPGRTGRTSAPTISAS